MKRVAVMSIPELFEDSIREAERHVAIGYDRLARQRELIERLARDGHVNMLSEARRLLQEMERLQREMEQHLVDQRRMAEDLRKRARLDAQAPKPDG